MSGRLYRSRRDRMLAGVAGGLAEGWGVDPSLVRIVWVLLVLFTSGVALLVYVVMAVVVPEEGDVLGSDTSGASTDPYPAGPVSGPWTEPPPPGAMSATGTGRPRDSGSGALIGGGLLIVIGVALLIRQYLPDIDFDWLWPVALVGLGGLLLVSALRRERPGGTGS